MNAVTSEASLIPCFAWATAGGGLYDNTCSKPGNDTVPVDLCCRGVYGNCREKTPPYSDKDSRYGEPRQLQVRFFEQSRICHGAHYRRDYEG